MRCAAISVGSPTPCSTLATRSPTVVSPSPAWWTPKLQTVTPARTRVTPHLQRWNTWPRPPPPPNMIGGKLSVVSCYRSLFVFNLFSFLPREANLTTLPSDSLLGSDEDGSSEVFLPADSDYDSSDALSPRDLDLLYSPPQDLSQQALHLLGGSAPDVLQIHELRWVR